MVRPELARISLPLQTDQWVLLLQDHPDTDFTADILSGITKGFQISYDRMNAPHKAKSNMDQAREHPEVVGDYLLRELERGAVLGPFEPAAVPQVHVSKFGVILKNHQLGKWRRIVDLSSPAGKSVNDGIPSDLCSHQILKLLKDFVMKGETMDRKYVDQELDSLLSSLDIDSSSYIEGWTPSHITFPPPGPSHAYNSGSFRPRFFSLPPNFHQYVIAATEFSIPVTTRAFDSSIGIAIRPLSAPARLSSAALPTRPSSSAAASPLSSAAPPTRSSSLPQAPPPQ